MGDEGQTLPSKSYEQSLLHDFAQLTALSLSNRQFWHSRPPRPQFVFGARRWSFATECRNTATLEMPKHTVESASDPVILDAAPDTVHDARYNLYCFSKDAETRAPKCKETAPCPPFPPLTRWYGWTRIESNDLPYSFHRHRDMEGPRDYEDLGFQYAIVYEYIRKSPEQDIRAAQAQIDFFYAAGFLLYQFRIENWNQGKLVDFGDLFRPVDNLNPQLRTYRRDASVAFAPADSDKG